jgi:hypothetical protein
MSKDSMADDDTSSNDFDDGGDSCEAKTQPAETAASTLDDLVERLVGREQQWSRAVVAGLRDAGYDSFDIGAVARRSRVSKPDLMRSLLGTTAEVFRAGLDGFASTDPDSLSAADIGVLPRFERSSWVPPRRVNAGDGNIRLAASMAWSAIVEANDPAQFFNLGGTAVWVKASPLAQAEAEEVTLTRMFHLLGKTIDWYKLVRGHEQDARPPKPVAEFMVADPHPPLPPLTRIVRTPVFDSGGTIVDTPGYHAGSGMFYAPRNLRVPPVLKRPTRREVARATSLLLSEILGDFPFVSDADRTNTVALVLLPFIRDLIDGPTPLHLVTKPTPGSGGSMLVEAALIPALGNLDMSGLPTGEAEVQRRITAALMSSPAAIVFDNLATKDILDSGQLSLAITSTGWSDRQMRTSKLLTLPVKCAWVATGNHVKVSDEIARRSVVIRLDPGCDNPSERTGFRHPNLLRWVKQHRPELIWAALTLVQAWVTEGMPAGGLTMGKFESWAEVTSGICEVVGLPDLHANWREWHEGQPSDVPLLQKVWAVWRSQFGDQKVKATNLLPIIGRLLDLDHADHHSAVTELGKRLGGWNGRIIDGYELVGAPASGSMSWRLVPRPS